MNKQSSPIIPTPIVLFAKAKVSSQLLSKSI